MALYTPGGGRHLHTLVLHTRVCGLTRKYRINVDQSGIGNLTSATCRFWPRLVVVGGWVSILIKIMTDEIQHV